MLPSFGEITGVGGKNSTDFEETPFVSNNVSALVLFVGV